MTLIEVLSSMRPTRKKKKKKKKNSTYLELAEERTEGLMPCEK